MGGAIPSKGSFPAQASPLHHPPAPLHPTPTPESAQRGLRELVGRWAKEAVFRESPDRDEDLKAEVSGRKSR